VDKYGNVTIEKKEGRDNTGLLTHPETHKDKVEIERDSYGNTKTKKEAKANPEEAPNIYMRYYNAMQKRLLQGKEKAEAFVSDKKVNVAVTKQDSIFPDIHLPGGISSKATEYKELAAKGDKWESPVFSIGGAKKSTDIPSVPRIERKAHAVSGGQTNGNVNGNVGALNGNIRSNINGNGLGNGLANGKGVAMAGESSTGGPLGGHIPAAY